MRGDVLVAGAEGSKCHCEILLVHFLPAAGKAGALGWVSSFPSGECVSSLWDVRNPSGEVGPLATDFSAIHHTIWAVVENNVFFVARPSVGGSVSPDIEPQSRLAEVSIVPDSVLEPVFNEDNFANRTTCCVRVGEALLEQVLVLKLHEAQYAVGFRRHGGCGGDLLGILWLRLIEGEYCDQDDGTTGGAANEAEADRFDAVIHAGFPL